MHINECNWLCLHAHACHSNTVTGALRAFLARSITWRAVVRLLLLLLLLPLFLQPPPPQHNSYSQSTGRGGGCARSFGARRTEAFEWCEGAAADVDGGSGKDVTEDNSCDADTESDVAGFELAIMRELVCFMETAKEFAADG